MRVLLSLLFVGYLHAGFVIIESALSSGGSESSSSSYLLRQGVGQSVVGEALSTSYIEQSGYYSWFLYVEAGVGIEESGKGEFLTFSLGKPFPNPFLRNVRVIYSVPEESRVRIVVYDVSGRLVRVLLDEVKEPGRYELRWSGEDFRGLRLPPGVYFLRMEGRNFKKTRKLGLM